ncbi:Crp/Fnr family transcriptional regulator [Variovorax sp. VNK109]|jgi:CRP-like cAMP-binding protein|uniref:Crp/Fnr family transcriptional regulator n=1 Tax=Variovorax sp. VNK109 TaxID=3400919 RepID=UPI003C0F21E0
MLPDLSIATQAGKPASSGVAVDFPGEFAGGIAGVVCNVAAGDVLLRRGSVMEWVPQLLSGRVALGLTGGGAQGEASDCDALAHRLGWAEGPFWLECATALLGLPALVDAVAETPVRLRRVPAAEFRRWLEALPQLQRTVVQDMALAQRRQSELAVSRLAKDAHARCAEWLLQHAEVPDAATAASQPALRVQLSQHKRLIAAQLGIAPETFSRVLKHLREQHYISGSGRTVNLTDPQGLRSLAGV